jgi:tRNA (guanine37-N1)-methyltransferase
MRIASLVKPGEVVANLFAGVGCYSIVIAKHSQAALIYSIDINPAAFNYARENIRLNKVGDKVIPLLGDAREIVERELRGAADRVLMPLPERARDFLDTAFLALKPKGGVIHFYDIGQEPDVFGPSFEFVKKVAAEKNFVVELLQSRKIRSYAPKCYHIALDFAASPA